MQVEQTKIRELAWLSVNSCSSQVTTTTTTAHHAGVAVGLIIGGAFGGVAAAAAAIGLTYWKMREGKNREPLNFDGVDRSGEILERDLRASDIMSAFA